MLRSLIQPENKLVKLCQLREWDKVKLLVSTSPREAIPTSSACRGIANTALVVAIRNKAPLDVITALVDANTDQLMKVRHHRHGNALHEAIKHMRSNIGNLHGHSDNSLGNKGNKSSDDIHIVLFLIRKIIQLERESRWLSRGELRPVKLDFIPSFTARKSSSRGSASCSAICSASVNARFTPKEESKPQTQSHPSESRAHTHGTLFNQVDHFKRTPLHYFIDKLSKQARNDSHFIDAVQTLVQAYPPAVGKHDTDGLTPLDICLTTSKNHTNNNFLIQEMEVEMKIYSLVQIMIQAFPSAAVSTINSAQATISIARPPGIDICSSSMANTMHEHRTHGAQRHGNILVINARNLLMNTVDGNVSHNTLSHALMNGRHLSTIELLIGASQSSNPTWHTGHITHGNDWDEYQIQKDHCNRSSSPSSSSSQLRPKNENQNENCMAIVSKDFEVPLHIAATMRASSEVIAHVVKSAPDAAYVPDRCNLTPICWTWIRFVIDGIHKAEREGESEPVTTTPATTTARMTEKSNLVEPVVKPSKRRFLPSSYLDHNGRITESIVKSVVDSTNNSTTQDTSHSHQFHHIRDMNNNDNINSSSNNNSSSNARRALWSKLSNLLPSAAKSVAYSSENISRNVTSKGKSNKAILTNLDVITEWDPVHAASYLGCPRGVLFTTLYNSPQSVKQSDELGNLPIHYAAASQGYTKSLPIGVNFSPKQLQEQSAVFDLVSIYPDCTKVMNSNGQLPIHIAIDKEKESRLETRTSTTGIIHRNENKRVKLFGKSNSRISPVELTEYSPLLFLVRADTESLEQCDGKTNLYPFLQAAVGDGSSLDIVFILLKTNPSLVK